MGRREQETDCRGGGKRQGSGVYKASGRRRPSRPLCVFWGVLMRPFHLVRNVDVTGVSGTGAVAEGVMFGNGKLVLGWLTEHTSVAVYDSLESLVAIHGHDGHTRIVWADVLDAPR